LNEQQIRDCHAIAGNLINVSAGDGSAEQQAEAEDLDDGRPADNLAEGLTGHGIHGGWPDRAIVTYTRAYLLSGRKRDHPRIAL
jgi:hypothetical protein